MGTRSHKEKEESLVVGTVGMRTEQRVVLEAEVVGSQMCDPWHNNSWQLRWHVRFLLQGRVDLGCSLDTQQVGL